MSIKNVKKELSDKQPYHNSNIFDNTNNFDIMILILFIIAVILGILSLFLY